MFLNKILKAMWKIFDNSPARRDTYIKIYEVDEFLIELLIQHSFYTLSLGESFNIPTLPLMGVGLEIFINKAVFPLRDVSTPLETMF